MNKASACNEAPLQALAFSRDVDAAPVPDLTESHGVEAVAVCFFNGNKPSVRQFKCTCVLCRHSVDDEKETKKIARSMMIPPPEEWKDKAPRLSVSAVHR